MTEGVAPFSATTREDWRGYGGADDVYACAGRAFPTATIAAVGPDGAVLEPDGVIAHVRTQIASYKRPQRVVFAERLPRNASLKVRKDLLRSELKESRHG
jgi:acyl-coenzyme A synthetase/AMP-(fatty) acid ligase